MANISATDIRQFLQYALGVEVPEGIETNLAMTLSYGQPLKDQIVFQKVVLPQLQTAAGVTASKKRTRPANDDEAYPSVESIASPSRHTRKRSVNSPSSLGIPPPLSSPPSLGSLTCSSLSLSPTPMTGPVFVPALRQDSREGDQSDYNLAPMSSRKSSLTQLQGAEATVLPGMESHHPRSAGPTSAVLTGTRATESLSTPQMKFNLSELQEKANVTSDEDDAIFSNKSDTKASGSAQVPPKSSNAKKTRKRRTYEREARKRAPSLDFSLRVPGFEDSDDEAVEVPHGEQEEGKDFLQNPRPGKQVNMFDGKNTPSGKNLLRRRK
jgi:hypothetical protein